jgi:hypothetical protein
MKKTLLLAVFAFVALLPIQAKPTDAPQGTPPQKAPDSFVITPSVFDHIDEGGNLVDMKHAVERALVVFTKRNVGLSIKYKKGKTDEVWVLGAPLDGGNGVYVFQQAILKGYTDLYYDAAMTFTLTGQKHECAVLIKQGDAKILALSGQMRVIEAKQQG